MQRISTLVPIALLLISSLSPLPASERSATFGGSSGWDGLSYVRNLDTAPGRLGESALVLSSAASASAGEADLRIDFDSAPFSDRSGFYDSVSSSLLQTGQARAMRGRGAALCNTVGSGLVLRGKTGSLFSTPGNPGSFTIEFWMQPAVTENGSVLFQWRSSRTSRVGSLYQYIRSSLFNNRMVWDFSNIWVTSAGMPLEITMTGRTNLIPGTWGHHRLIWDEQSGALEYRFNGVTEDIRHITSSGTETGDVHAAVFGSPADIEIAPRFSGLIDEFLISRESLSADSLEDRRKLTSRYPESGGRFETPVIDSGRAGSVLKTVTAVSDVPPQTGISLFARAGDEMYRWTESDPPWTPLAGGAPLSGLTGRFFQIAGELYPDGTGSKTPSLTSLTVRYLEDEAPWPPVKLSASPRDKAVALSWPPSVDGDAAGYLVYYGDRPGEYLGARSPIDAGSSRALIVDGLANGKTYYFSVAAYDSAGTSRPGPLSAETWARPEAGIISESPSR